MPQGRTTLKNTTRRNAETEVNTSRTPKALVDANSIGVAYGISSRYVLKLAAEGRIPCLRLGRKCVRFDPLAVADALSNNK